MKKQLERLQAIDRSQWELLAVVVMIVFALSTVTILWPSKGKLSYDADKLVYQGQVVNHRMNGQGKLTFENGDVYEGHFVNGVFDGQGKFVSKSGWSYDGHFKKGQADGQGVLTTASGKTYKGTFKQGIYQK